MFFYHIGLHYFFQQHMLKYLLKSPYSQILNSTIHRKNKDIHRKTIFLVVSIHVGISAAPFVLCYHLTGLFFKSPPLVEIFLTIKNSWTQIQNTHFCCKHEIGVLIGNSTTTWTELYSFLTHLCDPVWHGGQCFVNSWVHECHWSTLLPQWHWWVWQRGDPKRRPVLAFIYPMEEINMPIWNREPSYDF